MYPFRRAPLQSIAVTPATDGGKRLFSQLEQNTFTFAVYMILRATIDISVAVVTNIRNKGSAAALFDFVGINENGFDRVLIDPRVAAFIGQMRAPSTLSNVRLGAVAIATTNLVEIIPIFFSNPNSLNPGETAFRERNPSALTQAFVQFSATPIPNIVTVGGATVAFTNVSVDIMQVHNPNQKNLPRFVPFISQTVIPVSGTLAGLRIPIMSDRYLAALIVSQESTGEVVDIINSLSMLSDVRTYIGNQLGTWENLQRISETSFGGAVGPTNSLAALISVSAVKGPHLALDFMHHGQLSTLIEPNETNLRLLLNVQQSAVAAATSQIRVTTIEMVRDTNGYAAPGGGTRLVCDPSPLPWSRAS